MENAELIAKMRGRIDQCRRLAKSTTDQRTAQVLLQMAEEGERDVKKLEEEQIVITITPDQPIP